MASPIKERRADIYIAGDTHRLHLKFIHWSQRSFTITFITLDDHVKIKSLRRFVEIIWPNRFSGPRHFKGFSHHESNEKWGGRPRGHVCTRTSYNWVIRIWWKLNLVDSFFSYFFKCDLQHNHSLSLYVILWCLPFNDILRQVVLSSFGLKKHGLWFQTKRFSLITYLNFSIFQLNNCSNAVHCFASSNTSTWVPLFRRKISRKEKEIWRLLRL